MQREQGLIASPLRFELSVSHFIFFQTVIFLKIFYTFGK